MTLQPEAVPVSSEARPLALPRLPRHAVSRANRIAAANGAVNTTFGALPLRIALLPSGTAVHPDHRISFQLGDEALSFHCPNALLTLLLRACEPALALDQPPSASLLELLVDTLLLPSLPAWQRLLGAPVRLTGVHADRLAPDGAVGIQLSAAGQSWRAALSGDAAVDGLLDAWPALPHALPELPLPCRLWVGITELPASVVGGLRPEDAVIIETFAAGRLLLVVAERWAAQARRQNATILLTEALRPLSASERKNAMAASELGSGPKDAGSLEAIPIRLSFDAGHLDIPLAEVRRLQVGSIVPVGRGAAELVEISANGRRIGAGELVELEGAVAVRIVRLFGLD